MSTRKIPSSQLVNKLVILIVVHVEFSGRGGGGLGQALGQYIILVLSYHSACDIVSWSLWLFYLPPLCLRWSTIWELRSINLCVFVSFGIFRWNIQCDLIRHFFAWPHEQASMQVSLSTYIMCHIKSSRAPLWSQLKVSQTAIDALITLCVSGFDNVSTQHCLHHLNAAFYSHRFNELTEFVTDECLAISWYQLTICQWSVM